jgi:hypothetical protein
MQWKSFNELTTEVDLYVMYFNKLSKGFKINAQSLKISSIVICLKQGSFALNDIIQICKNIKT